MIKENQELDHLRLKKYTLMKQIENCSCWHGGIEDSKLVRNICFTCPDREEEIVRINKRIAKIESKIK